jgi:hypothetical protein
MIAISNKAWDRLFLNALICRQVVKAVGVALVSEDAGERRTGPQTRKRGASQSKVAVAVRPQVAP